jgi:hypothetical protein
MRMTGAENQPQAYTGGGLKIGGATQAQYAALNSGDNKQLMNLVYGLDTPPHIQQDAMDRLYNDVDTRRKVDRYKSEIEGKLTSGDIVGLQRSQRQAEKADEGSVFKAILYGFVNPQLAAAEWQKISPVYKSVGVEVGDKQYHAYVNPLTGEITKAKDPTTNELVDDKTLTQLNANYSGMGKGLKTDIAPGIFEKKDNNGKVIGQGRLYTEYGSNGKVSKQYVLSGNEKLPFDTSWTPQSVSTAASKADYQLMTDLKKKHGTNVLDAEKDYVALNGPFKSADERAQFRQVYGMGGELPSVSGAGAVSAAGAATTKPGQVTSDDVYNAIIGQESGGKHTDERGRVKISTDGAVGIGQIMPDTWRLYQQRGLIPKDYRIGDATQNAEGARIILDDLTKTYGGNLDQVAAVYFGGPGAVNKDGTINYDRKDGNGVTVRQYITGVRNRLGQSLEAGAGGGADLKKPLAQLKAESEISTAAGKSRAEQAGKNIDAELAKTQSIVDGAQKGLEAIKSGKHLLGGGANTAKYAYYDLNPLATRPEEFVNTQAILSLAAQDNISKLAQLIKPLSNTDLAYVQKYQLSRNSSPEEVNKWLYHYQEAAKVAYGRQVEAFQNPGKAPGSTVTPTTPNAASEQRIKKYNPATGRVE